jgi:hypothetical protein
MSRPDDALRRRLPSLSRHLVILAGVAWLATLSACPQERPGAEKEIPPQRIPPALVLEPQPSAQGAPASADGGVTRQP